MADDFIPSPVLDPRNNAEFIADSIWFTIGGVTLEQCDENIAYWEEIRNRVQQNGVNQNPKTALKSARAGDPHVVLLTNTMRPHAETRFYHNQLTLKARVELLRQQGVVLRPAQAAQTTLQFTKLPDFLAVEITIPAGTEISDRTLQVIVATDTALVIPVGELSGTVGATARDAGDLFRQEPGALNQLLQSIAGVFDVVNTTVLDGGADGETLDDGVLRGREEMRIGEHLGSERDYIDYLYLETLFKKGRIVAFEGLLGNFEKASTPGVLLLTVQGSDGLTPTEQTFAAVNSVIARRRIIGIQVTTRAPEYVSFTLDIQVKIAPGQSAATLIGKAKLNLLELFNPLSFPFGPTFTNRSIGFSDIIGAIEKAGPQLISVHRVSGADQITITIGEVEHKDDVPLTIGQLPKLQLADINIQAV
jgi:hypothetical protein